MSPKMKLLCSYIFPAVGSGFIREFWGADEYKNQAHGSAPLALAEEHFLKNGIYTSILTTDTAAHFYEKHGYISAPGCKAKNLDAVFVKHLVPQPDSARQPSSAYSPTVGLIASSASASRSLHL